MPSQGRINNAYLWRNAKGQEQLLGHFHQSWGIPHGRLADIVSVGCSDIPCVCSVQHQDRLKPAAKHYRFRFTGGNRFDLLNDTASMSYFYARQWRFDVGAVMNHVKRQESSSPTSTLHSTNRHTPFVGVTYQLSKNYEVYGRVIKEKNDNQFAGNTATLGFARNF